MHLIYQSKNPQVMGILNVTPDSFSDGGQFNSVSSAVNHAEQMILAGVDIIDIGGESTRPGAVEVGTDEELTRVIPVIEAVAKLGKPVSIDTSKPEVMMAAVEAGAAMINDVQALQLPGAIEAAARAKVPVCLMHMQGKPRVMQNNPEYQDVVSEVFGFLERRIQACESEGISRDFISVDPGFGFGKLLQHNLTLLKNLAKFQELHVPVLVGMSRKSMLGQITRNNLDNRLTASLSVALIAAIKGANIIRVHDVAETVDMVRVFSTIYRDNDA